MNEDVSVLVTGVGGDLGQAIVKALRVSPRTITCHGCDFEDSAVGSVFVDTFHAVPRADNPAYVKTLNDLCSSLKVRAVIPGSEAEINCLGQRGSPPALPSGVPVVCQDKEWLETYGDKLTCMMALSGRVELEPFADGLDSAAVEELVERCGFPVVVKERLSSGGKGVHIVDNRQILGPILSRTDAPVVQGFIDDEEGEYSVGIFSGNGRTHALAFERTLGPGGCSWHAEYSSDTDVLSYALRIAENTDPKGSINIQVRKSSKGIRLLEINPRFSSLAAARAVCGFRDVEWSLELVLGCFAGRIPKSFQDISFQRFTSEIVDFGEGFGRISQWDPKQVERTTL